MERVIRSGEGVPEPTMGRGSLLVTVEEAAAMCSLGRAKFYQLVMAGEVPSITIGRSRRIPMEGLRRWVAAQAGTPSER